MTEKCIADPNRDCVGAERANDVLKTLLSFEAEVKSETKSLKESSERQGKRIGELEAKEQVKKVEFEHFRQEISEMQTDIKDFQKESKNSINELRAEHKESMAELKKGNKEILDAVTPLKHKVESLEHLEEDVEEIKEKPGRKWENVTEKIIGLVIAAVVGFILAKIGLGG